jgi:hypothetical protein
MTCNSDSYCTDYLHSYLFHSGFIFLVGRAALTNHAAFSFSPEPLDRSKLFFAQVQGLIAAVLLLTILIELIASLIEYLKVGSANYVTYPEWRSLPGVINM